MTSSHSPNKFHSWVRKRENIETESYYLDNAMEFHYYIGGSREQREAKVTCIKSMSVAFGGDESMPRN